MSGLTLLDALAEARIEEAIARGELDPPAPGFAALNPGYAAHDHQGGRALLRGLGRCEFIRTWRTIAAAGPDKSGPRRHIPGTGWLSLNNT